MSTTGLNEQKAHLQESWQGEGRRNWTVTIPGLTVTFAHKQDAREFKELYDHGTKHERAQDAADQLDRLEQRSARAEEKRDWRAKYRV